MKIAGGCCLICALLCVVITVTTTVVHMNRLQTLHECVYTPQSKTCMCVSAIGDHSAQEAHRFVFNNTPNCEVVHGSLYSCLRVLFSFSVLGILLCISCSMLIYQLHSHEKKRVYWEQLELRRRFLSQRQPHHSICGCYDELYPWQLWEMLDYRYLAPHNNLPNNSGEEEHCLPSTSSPTRNARSGGDHCVSAWNWLPWPRQISERSRINLHDRSDGQPLRQSFMRRLMSRDVRNQAVNGSAEDSCSLSQSVGTLPWRSECIHIFRPSPHNTNFFPPVRFGIRARNMPYGRPHSNHRRTRSNDGIFHHLHMNAPPRYAQPYSLIDANGGISCHFSGCEIPRYMWGPPPPYSQPPSTENIVQLQSRQSVIELERLSSGMEIPHCDRVYTNLDMEHGGNGSVSSKISTPLSERRFLCHNFSSEGIRLTIGSNYTNICTQDAVTREHKREETCIVEVHVPYIFNKKDIVFNTLPTRSCRKKNTNHFKSLSNIPLSLSRKINNAKNEKSEHEQLSVVKPHCDIEVNTNATVRVTDSNNVCHLHDLKRITKELLCTDSVVSNSLETDTSPSSLSYQPATVEVPAQFKASLATATSPSTPVTENFTLTSKMYAQSMPNLNLSNSLPRNIRSRVPSSGNTSTSQDFADFELEDDSSPLVLCSPISDIRSLPPLPDDDASDSSSLYPPCPRLFACDHEALFSNDSSSVSCEVTMENALSTDSSSCEIIVVGDGDRQLSRTLHCRSTETTFVPFSSSPSIIISKRPPTECSIDCKIRHLHHYHPEKIEVHEVSEQMRGNDFNLSQERTSNFVVTIKSVNV
ncbi:uncharacterized protein LOC118196191 isoform X1 [Stegodyphus dumicola]|uniref:uncharacterized protein LOC118196191 isoform X1 n=1 Tax=Stegodyphus dumicola TaxID=202533 RepID=UPI0015B293BA|nr:uncharacterized protein LOC118196191 isoform X1 [Stegodyphus dumicola]